MSRRRVGGWGEGCRSTLGGGDRAGPWEIIPGRSRAGGLDDIYPPGVDLRGHQSSTLPEHQDVK